MRDQTGAACPGPAAAHQVALSGTAWRLWRDACVRSAGFPARLVRALCDDQLAAAADAGHGPADARQAYALAYRAAQQRGSAALTVIARDPAFLEAVTWQNPAAARNLLGKLMAEAPRGADKRKREMRVAAYLQRYCLKNDTIGFFGPVSWAVAASEDDDLTAVPGKALLARRTTYFESWAIDEVARAIAGREGVSGWLRPRRDPSAMLAGSQLHRAGRKPVILSAGQLRLLERCDGQRTVGELLAGPEPDIPGLLAELRDLGALLIDLTVPVQAWPERELREQVERIGDPAIRHVALRPLEEIVAARDAVAAAAGNPDELQNAMTGLSDAFERITGRPPVRRPGELYAGRTLVYEDAVRDVSVRLGRTVLEALAPPLGLALDSARWLTAEITDRYRALALELFERECLRAKTDQVPLHRLVTVMTPDLLTLPGRRVTEIVAQALEDFQERWQRVLRVPDGWVRRHSVSARTIADQAAALFPARPAAWSCARQHSPDLMIATASPSALRRGEFLLVLGELHMAVNTLENRCFVEQHPDPGRLLRAAQADHGGRRVVAIPRKDLPFVTSRLNPPTALLSPDYTYWASGNEAAVPPRSATVLPAAALLVSRRNGDLVVRCASSGAEFAFFEVIGDLMSGVVGNAFAPIATRPHQPRIEIDRLVLSREAWTFSMAEAPWAFVKDEAERYLLARLWRMDHQIPERAFYKVPAEEKPMATDFGSLTLVNLMAKSIRRSKDLGFTSFGVSEMLPDLDQLWLRDAAGERYTCELRMVATSAE